MPKHFNNHSKEYFLAIKKLVQRFYIVIILMMIVLISMNYRVLVENAVEHRQHIVSSYLALILSLGFFIVIAVPFMSLYTRKTCPNCNKYVIRYSHKCNHCGYKIRISRD
jgi:amino acid permease